tara:strand:- start:121 stop:360 length:240 start_codon:yes stop_codon:yes gene_type:complete
MWISGQKRSKDKEISNLEKVKEERKIQSRRLSPPQNLSIISKEPFQLVFLKDDAVTRRGETYPYPSTAGTDEGVHLART